MAFYNESNQSGFVISFTNAPRYDFGNFALGYKFVANLIAEKLMESEFRFPDYQAYPVVFLYRHAFELHLKNILYKGAKFLYFKRVEGIDHKLYNNHDLIQLSVKACQVLITAFPEEQVFLQEVSEKIKRTAREFHEIDKNSYAYRYPIDKDGNHSTSKSQFVSLESFASHMNNLFHDLENVDTALDGETFRAEEAYDIAEQLFGEFLEDSGSV
jgi:hypothetical protein